MKRKAHSNCTGPGCVQGPCFAALYERAAKAGRHPRDQHTYERNLRELASASDPDYVRFLQEVIDKS